MRTGLLPATRKRIATALRERREEIERDVATRVYAIAEPRETGDAEYLEGLSSALSTAIEYALLAVERGEGHVPDVPPSLLAQARMAARNRVALDVVLRRYVAGYALLNEYVLAAGGELGAGLGDLREVLAGQAAIVDRLLAAVSAEYGREAAGLIRSPGERLAERVRRLLAGERIDASDLGYELECFHLGAVGAGPGIAAALDLLASRLDLRLLRVEAAEGRTWAWLGRSSAFDPAELDRAADLLRESIAPAEAVALGEPGEGPAGWRFSHRQAAAAFPLAGRGAANVVRYSAVGLLASVERDETLARSLRELYLDRLAGGPDGGRRLRDTLRAYLAHGRSTTSTAAAVGVNRETVRNRVRVAEEKLGRPLDECAAELEVALRLADGSAPKSPLRLRPVPRPPNRPIA